MTEIIIAYHVAIVIAFISFGVVSGLCLGVFNIKDDDYECSEDKTRIWAWTAFMLYVLIVVIYMTYHCVETIGYYNECTPYGI